MANPNLQANREVCDVLISKYGGDPYLFIDTANATGINISADSGNANAKGRKRINFANPFNNTITLEMQVFPFKILALLGDGTIASEAAFSRTVTGVKSTEITGDTGKYQLVVKLQDGETLVKNSVHVYLDNYLGDSDNEADVAASEASGVITITDATSASKTIAKDTTYTVVYGVTRTTGVQKVALKDDAEMVDLSIEMYTLDKTDDGKYVPTYIKVYKANLQRTVDLNLTSDGDPVTLSLTFDVLTDSNGNNMDIIQLTAASSSDEGE